MTFVWIALGLACLVGGVAVAASPRRALRLPAAVPDSTELRTARWIGLAIAVVGVVLVGLALWPVVPPLPSVPVPPTPPPPRQMF